MLYFISHNRKLRVQSVSLNFIKQEAFETKFYERAVCAMLAVLGSLFKTRGLENSNLGYWMEKANASVNGGNLSPTTK